MRVVAGSPLRRERVDVDDHAPSRAGSARQRRGEARLAVPRDRAGTFEPVLVPERAGRISGSLDDMITSLYAHGTSVRDNHSVQAKPAHLAVGIGADGENHIPGIWPAKTPATVGESAGCWTSVMTGLRNRDVRVILITCTDGLNGLADAIHHASRTPPCGPQPSART
ncbi:transposase [Nonomuraea sp. GTA35]|uniref:transposase n=1 Tax=Nonomuraea sp. GTA35 TaxID=1676746 RepID=UPI0035C16477